MKYGWRMANVGMVGLLHSWGGDELRQDLLAFFELILLAENDGVVLFVGGGHKLERRDVKVGLQTAEDAEILSGLQEGDTVVFGEQGQFREGQIVTPKFVNAPGGE